MKQKIAVCPHCKTGQHRGKDFFSGTCVNCKKYFNIHDSLSEDEMVGYNSPTKIPVNKALTAQKASMEKKAYDYKESVLDKVRTGQQRSHEPDGKARTW